MHVYYSVAQIYIYIYIYTCFQKRRLLNSLPINNCAYKIITKYRHGKIAILSFICQTIAIFLEYYLISGNVESWFLYIIKVTLIYYKTGSYILQNWCLHFIKTHTLKIIKLTLAYSKTESYTYTIKTDFYFL